MSKELKQRTLKVRDIPKITRYLKTTKIKDRIYDTFFFKAEPKLKTWGEIRTELDLSKEEINELRIKSRGDIVLALKLVEGGEVYLPEERTPEDITKAVVDIIFDVFDEEGVYGQTIDLLADIYESDNETIEDKTIAELYKLVTDIVSDVNFPKL